MKWTRRRKLVLAVVIPVEVVSAALTWRDLANRDEVDLRGSKRFWRVFVVINPGNSIIYWLFGRR